ncbi:unnamed protein product, partial [Polarella glacialis]
MAIYQSSRTPRAVTPRAAASSAYPTSRGASKAPALAVPAVPKAPPAADKEAWGHFHQRRHRMQPPDLFDEAMKKFEKYGELSAPSARPLSGGGRPDAFPDLKQPASGVIAAAAATGGGGAAPRAQRQLDADLGLRKARFFDKCLRADRAVEAPRLPLHQELSSRKGNLSPTKAAESFSPRNAIFHIPDLAAFRIPTGQISLRELPNKEVTEHSDSDGISAEEESDEDEDPDACRPTLNESMNGLVNKCRQARLHPATTGIVRAHGDERLKLQYGCLTDARAEAMNHTLKATSSDVREAFFCSNGLTDKGAKHLLDAMPEEVEAVDLSENDLSHGQGWCLSFKKLTSLTSLRLSNCQLGDGVCKELVRVLAGCRCLTRMDLSGNTISAAGAAIRGLLKGHTALEDLDLHWNQFSGDGAKSLLRGLLENSKNGGRLHTVNLSWNPLGKVGGEEICQQLARLFVESKTLRHLDLSKCELSASQCQVLADGLKSNTSVLGLHIDGNEAHMDARGFLIPDAGKTATGGMTSAGEDTPGGEASGAVSASSGAAGSQQVDRGRNLAMDAGGCCWMCDRWRETRLVYTPGVSGPDVADVWVSTSLDSFELPIPMKRMGADFVAFIMAPVGPLRFIFQAGAEMLASRTAENVSWGQINTLLRAGIGVTAGSVVSRSGCLRLRRARLPGEQPDEASTSEVDTEGQRRKDPLEFEIFTLSTMTVALRPEQEPVCRALIPRRPGEFRNGDFPPEWAIERSLFAPYVEELSSRLFCERSFDVDWRLSNAADLAKDEVDRLHVRDVLRGHYAEIKVLYSSLCSVEWKLAQTAPEDRSRPLSFGIGVNEYTHMLVQHCLIGEGLSMEEADALFIIAAMPPAEAASWHPSSQMEGTMIQRH